MVLLHCWYFGTWHPPFLRSCTPFPYLPIVGVPSLQCTLRNPGTQVARYLAPRFPNPLATGSMAWQLVNLTRYLAAQHLGTCSLSSTDNNAPFSHPALVGPRPGEVRQGEPLRDRAEEEEQDVRLHHRALRHGPHLQRPRQKAGQADHPEVSILVLISPKMTLYAYFQDGCGAHKVPERDHEHPAKRRYHLLLDSHSHRCVHLLCQARTSPPS